MSDDRRPATPDASSAAKRRSRPVRSKARPPSWRELRVEGIERLRRTNQTLALDVPQAARVRLWKRGFLADKWFEYRLSERSPDEHVSDLQQLLTARINGRCFILVDDRLALQRLLRATVGQPDILVAVCRGHATMFPGWAALIGRPGEAIEIRAARAPLGQVPAFARLVDGMVEAEDGRWAPDAFVERLRGRSEDLLVLPRAARHPDLAAWLPDPADGLRLLVLRHPMPVGPRVAASVITAGRATFPIDLKSGRIGTGLSDGRSGAPAEITAHPAHGTEISGRVVPFWPETMALARAALIELPFLHQAGWEIVVGPGGPVIVAGASCPDLVPFQRHRPLLRDPATRAYYDRFGILDRRGPSARTAAPIPPDPATGAA